MNVLENSQLPAVDVQKNEIRKENVTEFNQCLHAKGI